MGREATKAIGNPWYEARKKAALSDERLASKEGDAELLVMSVSAVSDAELGITKTMPVDKAVQMANLYNAPQLLNHYCLHECPIGQRHPISADVVNIERVTVKLLKNTKVDELSKIKEKLMDIAEDGEISEEEKPDLMEILESLEKLARTVSELRIIGEIALSRK